MSLFQLRDVTLHSGAKSNWIIDCNALRDEDLETLAVMLVERLPQFGQVEGIPEGGLRLAGWIKKHETEGNTTTLIVDDVCTTGNSFREMRQALEDSAGGAWGTIIGACLFARGPCPSWVTPLLTVTPARPETR